MTEAEGCPDTIRAEPAGPGVVLNEDEPQIRRSLRAALRRHDQLGEGAAGTTFSVGSLRVDLAGWHVFLDDREVHLPPIEYKPLTALVRHAGKVLTHRQLLQEVWGPSRTEDSQSLLFYVAQLRRKLEAVPARPRYLLTEPGVGYRLAAE